ncbi:MULTISPECIES: S-layer homology domain-containing protein [unclassified Paenibacillus]|uniref:S-layer homology domain-containing protein n=1 Tax=unclassified Paenibacillus TaxID=185978 RepID=UPI0036262CC9
MNCKIWFTCFVMFMLLSLSIGPEVSRAEVNSAYSLAVSTSVSRVNEEMTVTLKGENLADLYGYEAVIEYDNSKLSFKEAKSSISGSGFSITPLASGNKITFAYTKMGKIAGISGNADLATITFIPFSSGSAELKLINLIAVSSEQQESKWDTVRTISTSIDAGSGTSNTGGSSRSGGSTVTNQPTVEKNNSGADIKFLEAVKTTTTDGKEAVVVSVNTETFTKAIELASGTTRIGIEVKGNEPVARVELPAASLADASKQTKETVVSVKYGNSTYDLPVSAIDFTKLAQSMNADVKDLKVVVQIEKVSGKDADQVSTGAQQSGVKLLGGAVKFNVFVESGSSSISVDNFGGTYITRTIELTSAVDSSKATGVLFNPATGELTFVPTTFENVGGVTVATIKRPGNSIYTVIEHIKTFADMNGHWAKADVELLASKLVVNGRMDQSFVPQGEITRAEFATLLVKGLGLSQDQSTVFKDVAATDWHAGYVGAAAKAGLVEGLDNGSFAPNANITREQMAVMIGRAMKMAGKPKAANVKRVESFTDGSSMSSWAKEAISQSIEAGIMNGKTSQTFEPSSNATRAEAAVVLKRLLQYAGFIN